MNCSVVSILVAMTGTKHKEEAMDKPPLEFLREREVCDKVKFSRVSLWKLEKAGQFPRRRRVGPNSVRWVRSEVEAWMESRAIVL